ncbi:ABC transporter substrate-binding protein [Paenibacillus sp. HB172176]|uniref:ABC transporter substrate-binding protein n=1 Tax=Paenibacillus sp. HB172176 TaxID=2493690 RepID=UPI00143A2EC6|nr:ABC transporter substrate-binding protein [Paenibacillus sp. HB172176]
MKMDQLRWKKAILPALIALMMVFMAACGANNDSNTNNNGANNGGQASATVQPTAESTPEAAAGAPSETTYPLTVKDATGTEIIFEQAPTAIVSLAPSETETIYAIGAGEYVVGVDAYSNYPEEATKVEQIGDMTTNIEAVVALNPDLVLASPSLNADAVSKLRELGIAVYASEPKTYDETIAKIEEIGKIVNKNAETAAVAEHMRQVKQEVTDAVKGADPKKVYLEFSPGWTVGSGEFLDELITLAGGVNIANGQAGWYEVNAEEVIKENPQVIIYPDFGEEKSSILAGIETRPGWDVIDAVKNNQMFAVTNDPLVRVGPRLADGLLELAQTIHPELVSK